MKTYSLKAKEIKQKWVVVDAAGKPLGRLASHVATILKGKDKPTYSPHLDMGDYVVVVNAAQVKVSGDKPTQKFYYRHSMYPGGMRQVALRDMLATHPDRVIHEAVKGMLPHGPLGSKLLNKLKVYAEASHPHEAQVKGSERAEIKEAKEAEEAKAAAAQAPLQPAEEPPQESKPSTPPAARTRRTRARSSEAGAPSTTVRRSRTRKE